MNDVLFGYNRFILLSIDCNIKINDKNANYINTTETIVFMRTMKMQLLNSMVI
jgi:hypothetical protein